MQNQPFLFFRVSAVSENPRRMAVLCAELCARDGTVLLAPATWFRTIDEHHGNRAMIAEAHLIKALALLNLHCILRASTCSGHFLVTTALGQSPLLAAFALSLLKKFLKKAAKEPIFMNVATRAAAEFMQTETAIQSSGDTYRGIIMAVVSNKGGAGSTTVATNIAIDLARQNRSVCLADLVLRSGSVTSFLNVEPTCCLLDIAKSLRRDHLLAIENAFVQHVSGLRVLAEPSQGALEARIKPADIDEILDRLVELFEFLVIDTPKEFDDMQLLALDRAEIVLFVTEMDAPSLKSARRTLEHFRRMGVDMAKIRVLLNRYITMEKTDLQTIENLLGMSIFWTIPDDYRAVLSAVNQGLSIQACGYQSEIARSYGGLSGALLESISLSM